MKWEKTRFDADADPDTAYHFDADPDADIRILPFNLMRFCADPDPENTA
jgi:hypothetical protein